VRCPTDGGNARPVEGCGVPVAGLVVVHAGYSAAFLTLAAVAAAGLAVYALAMPETRMHGDANVAPSQAAPAIVVAPAKIGAE
jgi:predicted MFS family arabinose efflux permease